MAKTASEILSVIQDAIYAIINGGAVQDYEIGGKKLSKYSLTELRELERYYEGKVSTRRTGGNVNFARLDGV